MIRKLTCTAALAVASLCNGYAQEAMEPMASTPVSQTFSDTRLVNMASVEVTEKGKLEVRLSQRFGEMLDFKNIGETFFGLETLSDLMLGVEYGAMENLSVGLSRAKGGGFMADGTAGMRQLLNGSLKYRLLRQSESGVTPVTITLSGLASLSTEKQVEGETGLISSYPEFNHRLAYHGQVLVARKVSDRLAVQASGAYTHRNLVPENDDQGMFSAGLGARVQATKWLGVVADATFPIADTRTTDNGYYPVYGLGLEFKTGCNTFQINLTNATGITETDYIPYNTGQWSNGDFRLGFSLSRTFGFKMKSAEVKE